MLVVAYGADPVRRDGGGLWCLPVRRDGGGLWCGPCAPRWGWPVVRILCAAMEMANGAGPVRRNCGG